MYRKIKSKVYETIEQTGNETVAHNIFEFFITTLVLLNVAAVIFETDKGSSHYQQFLHIFEIVSIAIFTIEYVLRIWSCNADEKFKGLILGRIKFAFSPISIIDLMAVLPFYIHYLYNFDSRIVLIFRIFRIFRILKLSRYNDSLRIFGRVFRSKKEELIMIVFMVFSMLLMISSIMYYIEKDAQPEKFASIFEAMWWGVATLTTVGYGDIYPVTPAGKILSSIIAILGIGIFALPTGLLASGFAEEVQKRNKKRGKCPHCGKDINEPPMDKDK
ncbi:MAG: ion transporter [Clostridia bacterium]|nr:ion transporter [Clostridia bacterium]